MSILKNITEKVGQKKNKQMKVHVGEAFYLWELLVARYDSLDKTQIYCEFINDKDFLAIVKRGIQKLKSQIGKLENIMSDLGITLPNRPPAKVNINNNITIVKDKMIFRDIHRGIQGYIDLHTRAFKSATNTKLRSLFKDYLIQELDMAEKLVEYGQLKGWFLIPPPFAK
ncbi:spore coat protein [Natroniella sp. ANB-PHB2]|uniref:spore coat protein n=1 Tax=Natroniella sp. ANB-PHB2 TaxID=3384444 RepID=UPI0038D4B267